MCRAESVLHAANNPMRVKTITFEIDHSVNNVLNNLRPRERASLGDVPDEEHRDAGRLREVDELHTATAKLRDRSRRRGQIGLVNHLDRIDDHNSGIALVDLIDDPLDVRLGEDEEI